MTITAKSADGVLHAFPDGTDSKVIDQVMKRYAFEKANPPSDGPQRPAPGKADIDGGISAGSYIGDALNSFGRGMVKGGIGIATLPRTIADLEQAGLGWAANKTGINSKHVDAAFKLNPLSYMPSHEQVTNAVEGVAGKFGKPETGVGPWAETIGEFAPNAAITAASGGASLAPMAASVLLPALASEGAGQLARKAGVNENVARLGGAVLGGGIGAAGGAGISALKNALEATPIPAARRAMINTLEKAGVDLTAGQKTGSKALGYAESQLGGNEVTSGQKEQFTKALLARARIPGDAATAEVMGGHLNKMGAEFDRLAANNPLTADMKLRADAAGVAKDYHNDVGPAMRAPIVKNIADEIGGMQQIDGAAYSTLRSKLEAKARSASPREAEALRDLKGALDDAMERGLQRANSPDLGAWQNVRGLYGDYMTIERAAAGAGQDAAMGMISPSALKSAITQTKGKRGYVTGRAKFSDLARAGEAIMKPLPDSGTGSRLSAVNMASVVGAGIGAVGGGLGSGLTLGGAGAAAGAALGPAIVGRVLMSKRMQGFLSRGAEMAAPRKPGAGMGTIAARLGVSANQASIPAPTFRDKNEVPFTAKRVPMPTGR